MQLLCLKVTARYLGSDWAQTRSSGSLAAGCICYELSGGLEMWRRWLFMFVARYDTYVFSLLADEALQLRRAFTAGKSEDKLIGLVLTLDTGKMLQSMSNAGGCFTFVARFVTYTFSLLADVALQWRCVLTAGNREDKLISTELTLDIGKMLQSMPMHITIDLSIVSKVNVVVLAVPSFAYGQFLRPSPFMKPGIIVAVMTVRSGGDILSSLCSVRRRIS